MNMPLTKILVSTDLLFANVQSDPQRRFLRTTLRRVARPGPINHSACGSGTACGDQTANVAVGPDDVSISLGRAPPMSTPSLIPPPPLTASSITIKLPDSP